MIFNDHMIVIHSMCDTVITKYESSRENDGECGLNMPHVTCGKLHTCSPISAHAINGHIARRTDTMHILSKTCKREFFIRYKNF